MQHTGGQAPVLMLPCSLAGSVMPVTAVDDVASGLVEFKGATSFTGKSRSLGVITACLGHP